MDIFENLENLEISEECFNDIMDIVEEVINEVSVEKVRKAAENSLPAREAKYKEAKPNDTFPDYNRFPDYQDREDRYEAAKELSKLPKGDSRDMKKLRKAARKVILDRAEKAEDAWTFDKSDKEKERTGARSDKAYLFATDGKNNVQEFLQEIKNMIASYLAEDLEGLTLKKFGAGSPQHNKADDLWDKAWCQAQTYFRKKGANHDLSTKQDLGIEKFDDNRLKQVKKREEGRNKHALKNGLNLIPKKVTPESSMFKPNVGTNERDPESGVAKAIRRNNVKKRK